MSDRRTIAIVVILVTVLGMGVIGIILNVPRTDLLQVPPPSVPPGENPEIIISHGLEVWAEASYGQDFMPFIPREGPPFYTLIRVNVTNTGETTVSDFEAIRMTIYFDNTSVPLVTLNLTLVGDWQQIGPGENTVLVFTNSRDSIFSPTIDEGTELYGRILTRWGDGIESILTTPPSAVLFTH